jgi:tRNA1Val (adenine37-N6)-methyltransferase
MSVFQFKQFNVKQQDSAMKIGTDSLLLGCLAEAKEPKYILDIGTGTGVLALMMAQRFHQFVKQIDAVEIEHKAYEEAQFNFQQSPWAHLLKAHHVALQRFEPHALYDLIITNPPYFISGKNTLAPTNERNLARHNNQLSFSDLLQSVQQLLQPNGSCWMVLPMQEAEIMEELASDFELYVSHHILVYGKQEKQPNRKIFALCKTKHTQLVSDTLCIYNKNGTYTHQYHTLTLPFLLWK